MKFQSFLHRFSEDPFLNRPIWISLFIHFIEKLITSVCNNTIRVFINFSKKLEIHSLISPFPVHILPVLSRVIEIGLEVIILDELIGW